MPPPQRSLSHPRPPQLYTTLPLPMPPEFPHRPLSQSFVSSLALSTANNCFCHLRVCAFISASPGECVPGERAGIFSVLLPTGLQPLTLCLVHWFSQDRFVKPMIRLIFAEMVLLSIIHKLCTLNYVSSDALWDEVRGAELRALRLSHQPAR